MVYVRLAGLVSTSEAKAERSTVLAVSSVALTLPAPATGASLTGVTVIETVAGLESASPSLAVKVKLSDPL